MSQEWWTLRSVATRAIAAASIVLGSILIVAATPRVAPAQVVAQVNGEPITEADIAGRLKFEQLATRREWSRREVVEELIDEKLKLQAARRVGIDVADSDVDNAYAAMAKRMKLEPDQLTGALAHAGVDA